MDVPTTIEAVIIIVLILLPGYVCSVVLGRAIAFLSDSVDFRYLLRILAIGMAIHAILFPFWTRRIVAQYTDGTLDLGGWEMWAWSVIAVLLLPVVAGILVSTLVPKEPVDRVLDRIGLGWVDRLPAAWDYAVRLSPSWVKIYLNDGSVVGARFAEDSIASLTRNGRDLYVETVYTLDDAGNLAEPVRDSLGMWISADAISRIEFLLEGIADGGDVNAANHESTDTGPTSA